MKNRIALLGPDLTNINTAVKTSSEMETKVSNNTGNMAWIYAISKQIGADTFFGWGHSARDITENYDHLVIGMANSVILIPPSGKFDKHHVTEVLPSLEALCDLIDGVEVPMTIIGLGSQSGMDMQMTELAPASRRLLDCIKNKKINVSIRGNFTAKIFEAYGITKYAQTACPSNFINPDLNLGKHMEDKFRKLTDVKKLAMNVDVQSHTTPIVPTLVNWLKQHGGSWIAQTFEEISYLRNDATEEQLKQLKFAAEKMNPSLIGNNDHQALTEYVTGFLDEYCEYFFDVEHWMEFLSKFELSTGTRLHGNMLAWQAGVPAVWIIHDSRTKEINELMGLPVATFDQVTSASSLNDFMGNVEFDGEKYDHRRAELAKVYTTFLQESGIELCDEFRWMKEFKI